MSTIFHRLRAALMLCLSTGFAHGQTSFFVSGGANATSLKNSSIVNVNANVKNHYATHQNTQWDGIWGFGFYDTLYTDACWPFQITLGATGYWIDLGNIKGTQTPFINGGAFDTLNYQFNVETLATFLESRFVYTKYHYFPYAVLGIGGAWNHLNDYSESPSNAASSASAVSPSFSNHTQLSFAYELGIGVQYPIYSTCKVTYSLALDYRFLGLGWGQLGSFPTQAASSRLQVNNINTQAIFATFNITV